MSRNPLVAFVSALLLLLTSTALHAQTIRGVVLDSLTRQPVEGAIVTLLDSTADVVALVRTSDRGRFALTGKGSAFYAFDARSLGYRRHISQWVTLAHDDTVEVTVRISRLPISLSAVRIRAERDDIRARPFLGMSFRAMGAQIITPSELDAFRGGERDYLDLLQWVLPPAFAVRTLDAAFATRCVTLIRAQRCSLVFVDNMRMADAATAIAVTPPEQIHHVVVVRPADAGVLFGTGSEAGVIMIFTKAFVGAGWR